jgi:hypothetical protein
MADMDKYPTQDEREASACAKRTEKGKGKRGAWKGRFWAGMNVCDETDECSHQPVGRMLARGFAMMSNDEVIDDEWEE